MTGFEAYLDVEEREARHVNRAAVRRLLARIWEEKALLALGLALVGAGTGATLLEPRLFGYAIDEAIIPKRHDLLWLYGAACLAASFARVACMIGNAYVFERLGQRVMQDLRQRLFAHLMALPVSVYDKNPAGRLVTRVTNDIASMADMFSSGFVTMIGNALVVIGILSLLLALDLRLGLIAASVFPLLGLASVHFSRQLRVAYRNARSRLSALNAFLAENILGMRVVQLFNRQSLHLSRFAHVNQWYADAQIGSVRVFAYFQPSITLAAGASMALVIYFGGGMAADGRLPLGVLVTYFAYVLSLFQPMREIADKWNVFLSGIASAERIYSLLDWKPELESRALTAAPRRLEGVRGHVTFEGVWFAYGSYPSGEPRWVLKDFSVDLPPGTRLGVVGHTGAGKTTVINLLLRFYEPQRGRILLDGRDLRDYDRRELRTAIGLVQQDVFLFSGSVSDNVSLWRKPVDRTEDALQALLADSGLDRRTDLLERGSNLSMGERQIVSFARALASDPAVWILDEATANVDSESEGRLQRALRESSGGRTTILIAHRLATVRDADRIVVLHKGALVEQGRHAELVARDGLYARLYRYQAALGSQSV